MTNEPHGKALGGIARKESLSPERRKDIASDAAKARWKHRDRITPVKATHAGTLRIGELEIECANLPDGRRVLSEKSVLTVLGRGYSGYYSQRDAESVTAVLPRYLAPKNLHPFVSEELRALLSTPIYYVPPRGSGLAYGMDATVLPQVCDVWLTARTNGVLNASPAQLRTALAAELIVRGLAQVGIIALVDEATGFQHDRARDALAKILEEFIAKELRPWVHTFPDEFYKQLFRLRGIRFPGDTVRRPQYFGHLTNDIVYKRLAPGVLEELKKATAKDSAGKPSKPHLHRRLTENVGHPKLREHLASVVTVMKLSTEYADFLAKLDSVLPRYGETVLFNFGSNDDDIDGL